MKNMSFVHVTGSITRINFAVCSLYQHCTRKMSFPSKPQENAELFYIYK